MTIPINQVIPSHRRSMDAKKWFVVVYKFMHGANKELPIVYVLLKKLPRNNIIGGSATQIISNSWVASIQLHFSIMVVAVAN